MAVIAQATPTRVTSRGGTRLAVFVSGAGRPLVVVHGTTSDHTTWRLVLPYFEPHLAVHALDRRGRGESGDGANYSIEKEYTDVAAVVDEAAAATGSPVDLLGHSYGGVVAFGAAALTANVRKLVLYEGWPVPDVAHRTIAPPQMTTLEILLAEGRPELMLETFYRDVVKMSEEEIGAIKAAPTWAARVASAWTVPRELRAVPTQSLDTAQAAKIAMPVLLLVGSESPADIKADPDVVAGALPDARIRVLDGQMHAAHLTDPEYFAKEVLLFLRD